MYDNFKGTEDVRSMLVYGQNVHLIPFGTTPTGQEGWHKFMAAAP